METSPSFLAILEVLGATEIREREGSEFWRFYTSKFKTPAGNITAQYLYLLHNCPQNIATRQNLSKWNSLSENNGYTIVTTTKSELSSNLDNTTRLFHAKESITARKLLQKHVVQRFIPQHDKFERNSYFVDPDVCLSNDEETSAQTYFVRSLGPSNEQSPKQTSAEILIAPAGLGKTTLCREVARQLSENHNVIPILVESAQWQNLINLTLPNIFNAALLQTVPEALALTNEKTFKLLIREQLVVLIFDGFDELCLDPKSGRSPNDLLEELIDLVGDTGARILITVRDTFWEKHGNIRFSERSDRLEEIKLQGFSNAQRKRFFEKRLETPEEKDIARRLSREVGERLYEKIIGREGDQKDRASGVPMMLEMVALYVHRNPEATFSPASKDPFGPLLSAVCERENIRQNLNIPAEKQMEIFEDIFKNHEGDISKEELALYLEYHVLDVLTEHIDRFEYHAFFSPGQDLRPRFETLRIYFIARWLANRLEECLTEVSVADVATSLESSSTGSNDVFDFLLQRFQTLEPPVSQAAISHAFEMIRVRPKWERACSALFQLTQGLAHISKDTKTERLLFIFKYLGMSEVEPFQFSKIAIHGQVLGLDLQRVCFDGCSFNNLEFKSCVFSERTEFKNCKFAGSLEFESCESPGSAKLDGCVLSREAELSWNKRRGIKAKVLINDEIAKQALRDILRKFVGPFGFSQITEANRVSGAIMANPCGDDMWKALFKSGVVERHRISGVKDGGIHVVEDDSIRQEIKSFMDNAAVGPRLGKTINTVLNT